MCSPWRLLIHRAIERESAALQQMRACWLNPLALLSWTSTERTDPLTAGAGRSPRAHGGHRAAVLRLGAKSVCAPSF